MQYEDKERHEDDWAALMGEALGKLFGGVVGALLVVAVCWAVKLFT